MNRRPSVVSLLALVPAILLLMVIPAATLSGVPDFWRGFLMGSGAVFMTGAAVLAVVIGRSSDKGNSPRL